MSLLKSNSAKPREAIMNGAKSFDETCIHKNHGLIRWLGLGGFRTDWIGRTFYSWSLIGWSRIRILSNNIKVAKCSSLLHSVIYIVMAVLDLYRRYWGGANRS